MLNSFSSASAIRSYVLDLDVFEKARASWTIVRISRPERIVDICFVIIILMVEQIQT